MVLTFALSLVSSQVVSDSFFQSWHNLWSTSFGRSTKPWRRSSCRPWRLLSCSRCSNKMKPLRQRWKTTLKQFEIYQRGNHKLKLMLVTFARKWAYVQQSPRVGYSSCKPNRCPEGVRSSFSATFIFDVGSIGDSSTHIGFGYPRISP